MVMSFASAELYDPTRSTATGKMNDSRVSHTAASTHFATGQVLIAGGQKTKSARSRHRGTS